MPQGDKMRLLSRYIMREGAWDDVADAWSHKIPHDFPGHYPTILEDMVVTSHCRLSKLSRAEDGQQIGFLVWRVEGEPEHLEFVIVAMFGRDGEDLTGEYAPQVESLARAQGCAGMRFHTMRPGLIKKAESHGYRVSEIILRKALDAPNHK